MCERIRRARVSRDCRRSHNASSRCYRCGHRPNCDLALPVPSADRFE
jgi:hypothetical protein